MSRIKVRSLAMVFVIFGTWHSQVTGQQQSSPQGEQPGAGPAPDWLGWGGPKGNFRLNEAANLIDDFGGKFPKRLWKRPLGDGYSAIVAKAGRLYTQYRNEDREVIVALDSASGETLWEQDYQVSYYPNMDLNFGKGPNASPLIVDERLFTVSIAGEMRATELASGELIWRMDLHERFGSQKRKEEYGYSASPIAYTDRLIVLVGGDQHGVVALNPGDGKVIWSSPPSRVSYAQPTIIQVEGQDQLVFFSPTEVIGLNLENGKFLWRYPVKCYTENNLTPALQLDERHLWVASQLDGGSRILKLPARGSNQPPEVSWESPTIRQAHWHSFVEGDFIYGSFGGNSNSFLAGFNWRTGTFVWRQRGFHLAKGVMADGKFYFTDENGQLVIAKLSPQGVEILDAYQILSRVSWTAPTLVGTKLFLRDREHILAVELAKP